MEDDKKELHDSNKDSVSCAGSSEGSTINLESNNCNTSQNGGMDNEAFENSVDMSQTSSSPRSPSEKKNHTEVDMEMEEFTPPKIIPSEKESALNEAEFNDSGSTNGQVGDYFISINEHKKGLRGEKLIVTKDNRPNQSGHSGCRKCICWTIGIIFVVAAATIGGLIGVGIIDPKPHRTLGQKDGRSRDILREEKPFFSEVLQSGIETNNFNDFHHFHTEEIPAGYLKHAFDGKVKITNLSWDNRLADPTSPMFQDLSAKVKSAIEEVIYPLESDTKNKFYVSIKEFSPGSVVVHFRLGWSRQDPEAIDVSRDVILHRFENSLESNQGLLGTIYNAEPSSVSLKFITDGCIEMKCGGSCEYDLTRANFVCVCPDNAYLNSDGISCVVTEDDVMEMNGPSTPRQTTVTMDYIFEDEASETTFEESTEATKVKEASDIPRFFGEDEQSTEAESHSVEWLNENGDLLASEEDSTTLVKVGHVETTEAGTTQRVQWTSEEDSDESSVLWTTKLPEENILEDKETPQETPVLKTTTTEAATPVEEEQVRELLIDDEDTEELSATTPVAEIGDASTEFGSIPEGTTEETATESSTSQIEITFAMSKDKEMPPEFHEQLEQMLDTIMKDMTTTTTEESVDDIVPESVELNHDEAEMTTLESVVTSEVENSDLAESEVENESIDETATPAEDETSEAVTEISIQEIPDSEPVVEEKDSVTGNSQEIEGDHQVLSITTTTEPASEPKEAIVPEYEAFEGDFQEEPTTATPVSPVVSEEDVEDSEEALTATTVTPAVEETGDEKIESIENESETVTAHPMSLEPRMIEDLDVTTPASEDEVVEMKPVIEISGLGTDLFNETFQTELQNVIAEVLTDEKTTTTEPSSIENELQSTEGATTFNPIDTDAEATTLDDVIGIEGEIKREAEGVSRARPRKLSSADKCTKEEFRCDDGSCIDTYARCDGIFDCIDSSDEIACNNATCKGHDFKCQLESRCIPDSKRCDGIVDCLGGEDEENCSSDCGLEGHEGREFFCEIQGRCIPMRMRCDGEIDCASGEDEENCQCRIDQFKCQMGGGCVSAAAICDGFYDCPDGSDEWNCLRIENKVLQVRNGEDLWKPVCSTGWNKTWSSLACTQLGYDGSNKTNVVKLPEPETGFFSLNSTVLPEIALTLQGAEAITPLEECDSAVSLSCKDFKCGNWSLGVEIESLSSINSSSSVIHLPAVAYLLNVRDKASCTVSIIHPKWVITSYSCLTETDFDPSQWVALSGSSDDEESGNNFQANTQIKLVKRMVIHPRAKEIRGFVKNDFALIELLDPFDLNDEMNTVCLADKDPQKGQECITAGWTNVGSDVVNLEEYIEYIPEPIVDLEACNSTDNYNGRLDDSVICTGQRVLKSPCKRDKGAPLMCLTDSGVWQLQGVLTREGECQVRPHPDVFSSVVDAKNWIENVIGLKN